MDNSSVRILVIEDNPGDARLIEERLAAQPLTFVIDVAGELASGLQLLGSGRYDVLLLDLDLPDSPRHQTLQRAVAAAPEMPIVVLTGLRDESIGMESVHAGAQDYLVKEQASADLLTRSIRYAMERKGVETQLRHAHDQLELRVKERTVQLERTLAELNEEYRARARLERDIVRIGEMERQRIGRDLHDTLGSKLTGVAFLAKALERKLGAQEHPAVTDAASIVSLLNEAISQTRALARGLRQVELAQNDLEKALRDLLDDIRQVFNVDCRLDLNFSARFHDPSQASHLYHIVNESVTNAVKHAAPTHIWIQVTQDGAQGLLLIRNDGKGLPGDFRQSRGMGIQTMEYRAKIIGGRLEVTQVAEGGTEVRCTFPLGPPA